MTISEALSCLSGPIRRASWPLPGTGSPTCIQPCMIRVEPTLGVAIQRRAAYPRAGWAYGWRPSVEDLTACDWEAAWWSSSACSIPRPRSRRRDYGDGAPEAY